MVHNFHGTRSPLRELLRFHRSHHWQTSVVALRRLQQPYSVHAQRVSTPNWPFEEWLFRSKQARPLSRSTHVRPAACLLFLLFVDRPAPFLAFSKLTRRSWFSWRSQLYAFIIIFCARASMLFWRACAPCSTGEGGMTGLFGSSAVLLRAGRHYEEGEEFLVSYGPKGAAGYLEENGCAQHD